MSGLDYVTQWFQSHVSSEFDIKGQMEKNYLEGGHIDSFGFLELVADCESAFGIEFSDDDFANDAIFTIRGLADAIQAKKEEQG